MKRDTREEGDDDDVFRADAGAFWSPSRVMYPARDSCLCVSFVDGCLHRPRRRTTSRVFGTFLEIAAHSSRNGWHPRVGEKWNVDFEIFQVQVVVVSYDIIPSLHTRFILLKVSHTGVFFAKRKKTFVGSQLADVLFAT